MDKVEMMAVWLQRRGLSTSKPFRCLSPQHRDAHPSMSFDRQHGRVRCFGCGVSWDVYDCEAVAEGAPLEQKNGRLQPSYRLPAVKKTLLSQYGLSEGENSAKGPQTPTAAQNGPQSAPEPSYRQSMERVAAAQRQAAQTVAFAQRFLATGEGLRAKEKELRDQAIEYLEGRGISLETAIKKGWALSQTGISPRPASQKCRCWSSQPTKAQAKRTGTRSAHWARRSGAIAKSTPTLLWSTFSGAKSCFTHGLRWPWLKVRWMRWHWPR